MAKRFTDTDKWRDPWFWRLKPAQKLLWMYLLDTCDIAGVVEIDLDYISRAIGVKVSMEGFEGRLIDLGSGKYWIKKFIEFQQHCSLSDLNENNKAHLGIIRIARKYDLYQYLSTPSIPSTSTLQAPLEGLHSPPGIGIGIGKGIVRTKKIEEVEIPNHLVSVWEEFRAHRKEIKKPLTPRSEKIILSDLRNHSPDIAVAMVQQSIKNGWQGIFDLKDKNNGKSSLSTDPKRNAVGGIKPEPGKYTSINTGKV